MMLTGHRKICIAADKVHTPSDLSTSPCLFLMSSQKDFTVAIVGGGIVGLTCAITLARAGIEVDIFEAAVRNASIDVPRM